MKKFSSISLAFFSFSDISENYKLQPRQMFLLSANIYIPSLLFEHEYGQVHSLRWHRRRIASHLYKGLLAFPNTPIFILIRIAVGLRQNEN